MTAEGRYQPFAINAVDSAMAYASPAAARWLDMIGQGAERAYRRALLPIFDAHRNAPKECVADIVDAIVVSISFVSIARSLPARAGGGLDDERGADLASFFIQRAKHMNLAEGRAALARIKETNDAGT